jgi:hypothetical protein
VTTGTSIDGVLVQRGETLFYPANRIVRPAPAARLDTMTRRKAAVIRQRIVATVVRRAPQVMVKVTGGGRGMGAIAAHFKYISKNGKLSIEDDRCVVRDGKEAMHDLVEQWRHRGSLIDEVGYRREAFNIMLSMPHGTDAQTVLKAAREFANAELLGHRYVMVLHQHQAHPHVHLSVRAESVRGDRLNPRKADLHRWRETFAEKLRGWGIAAEATRQATRGVSRNFEPLWRLKAKEQGRLRTSAVPSKTGSRSYQSRADAAVAWAHITKALAQSHQPEDQKLAEDISRFLRESPFVRQQMAQRQKRNIETTQQQPSPAPQRDLATSRQGPEIER